MTTEMTNDAKGVRIIVEGPDCVGKDTFIARMMDYIRGVNRFNGANLTTITSGEVFTLFDDTNTVLSGMAQTDFFDRVLGHEYDPQSKEDRDMVERYGTFSKKTITFPKYGNVISVKSIHTKDGSPESAEFIRKLDGGELTDQRVIAEEYLQAHYDLERLAKTLTKTYSLVIMNRSLISFYAMQLHAFGFEDLRWKWEHLWNLSEQRDALYIRLTAPEEVVRERMAKREAGGDFRGEVETFYMNQWRNIETGFINAQKEGFCKSTITIDTTRPDNEIDAIIESIADMVTKREMIGQFTQSNQML